MKPIEKLRRCESSTDSASVYARRACSKRASNARYTRCSGLWRAPSIGAPWCCPRISSITSVGTSVRESR